MLVDDEPHDNYFHKRVINKAGIAQNIVTARDGVEALELLTTKVEGQYLQPNLVFLDINMPRMNGWEFLEAYENLPAEQKAEVVVMMLTTSLNIEDRDRALNNPNIRGFHSKPLTEEALMSIMGEYFPE